ncbi:MAG TPA: hypothetical protein VGX70_08100, partial [Gemmataceae bacterium]|nr:hypothetical protein [Gemmataceae bacterium]
MEALEDRSLPSTLLVTSQADDGTLGTIRYEVGLANSGDTIAFALPIGTTSVSLSKGEILINKNLTINGGGDSVSAGGNSRIFEIGPAATVTMTNLTLDNGFDATGGGGAIRNEGNLTLVSCYLFTNTSKGGDGHGIPGATPGVSGGGGAGGGGAISNLGSLTINNSTLFNNYAQGGAGANANDYQGAGGGGGGFGGAVFDLGGVVTITDSTFTG